MFIKSRTGGGFGDKWRQLSKLAKLALITTAIFFILGRHADATPCFKKR